MLSQDSIGIPASLRNIRWRLRRREGGPGSSQQVFPAPFIATVWRSGPRMDRIQDRPKAS